MEKARVGYMSLILPTKEIKRVTTIETGVGSEEFFVVHGGKGYKIKYKGDAVSFFQGNEEKPYLSLEDQNVVNTFIPGFNVSAAYEHLRRENTALAKVIGKAGDLEGINAMRLGSESEKKAFREFYGFLVDHGYMSVTKSWKNPVNMDYRTLNFVNKNASHPVFEKVIAYAKNRLKGTQRPEGRGRIVDLINDAINSMDHGTLQEQKLYVEFKNLLKQLNLVPIKLEEEPCFTEEQLMYVLEYDVNVRGHKTFARVVVDFLRENAKMMDNVGCVNRTLAKMQYGTEEERTAFNNLMAAARDMNIIVLPGKRKNTLDERAQLIEAAEEAFAEENIEARI